MYIHNLKFLSFLTKSSEMSLGTVVILPLSYMKRSIVANVFKPETSNTYFAFDIAYPKSEYALLIFF